MGGAATVSSRPALIRQRDVTRIVKGFAAAGKDVQCFVEGGIARFEPINPGEEVVRRIPAVIPGDAATVDEDDSWRL